MKIIFLFGLVIMVFAELTLCRVIETQDGEMSVHFGFKTDNGYSRTEDIKYNNTMPADSKDNDVVKPVEYRGGYSFISDDGYEYTVLYKANKNGFHPYVTAKKIKKVE